MNNIDIYGAIKFMEERLSFYDKKRMIPPYEATTYFIDENGKKYDIHVRQVDFNDKYEVSISNGVESESMYFKHDDLIQMFDYDKFDFKFECKEKDEFDL